MPNNVIALFSSVVQFQTQIFSTIKLFCCRKLRMLFERFQKEVQSVSHGTYLFRRDDKVISYSLNYPYSNGPFKHLWWATHL